MTEFYVGYLPKAPERLARTIFRLVLALGGITVVLALLLAFAQGPFARSSFEYLQNRDYSGSLIDAPYPSLLTDEGRFLLVAPGKHGAADLVGGLINQRVKLQGSLIRRGDDKMIELVPGSVRATGGQASPPPLVDLGTVTLTGEIVDSKCYLGVMNPGNGKVHRDCAVRCLSGGIPPAFIVADAPGTVRTLILSGVKPREVLDFVAEPVRIQGRLQRLDRTLILAVARSGNRPAIERH